MYFLHVYSQGSKPRTYSVKCKGLYPHHYPYLVLFHIGNKSDINLVTQNLAHIPILKDMVFTNFSA